MIGWDKFATAFPAGVTPERFRRATVPVFAAEKVFHPANGFSPRKWDCPLRLHSPLTFPAMTTVPDEHRRHSPESIACAVITVSDTRTASTDVGGRTAVDLLQAAGHRVLAREILPDEPEPLATTLQALCRRGDIDAVLLTGGTGLGSRDRTFETLAQLLDKRLPGYGELFRMLSFEEIGPAAMLSRATGGVLDRTVVLSMPGSPAGVRLALEKVILPELGHLVREAQR